MSHIFRRIFQWTGAGWYGQMKTGLTLRYLRFGAINWNAEQAVTYAGACGMSSPAFYHQPPMATDELDVKVYHPERTPKDTAETDFFETSTRLNILLMSVGIVPRLWEQMDNGMYRASFFSTEYCSLAANVLMGNRYHVETRPIRSMVDGSTSWYLIVYTSQSIVHTTPV